MMIVHRLVTVGALSERDHWVGLLICWIIVLAVSLIAGIFQWWNRE